MIYSAWCRSKTKQIYFASHETSYRECVMWTWSARFTPKTSQIILWYVKHDADQN